MPAMELLLYLGAASVALVAILTAGQRVGKVLKAIWRTINRFNEVADDLLGDKAKGIPSMKDRVIAVEDWQRKHAEQAHPETGLNGPLQRGRRR